MTQLAIISTQLPCERDMCPINDRCNGVDGAICSVHTSYINEAAELLFKCGKDGANVKIASQMLMPLYTQLFKLQRYEMSLTSPMIIGRMTVVNPIYKEIRALMRDIVHMWKIVGLGVPVVAAPTPVVSGHQSYYDMLTGTQDDPGEADVPIPSALPAPNLEAAGEAASVIGSITNFNTMLDNDPELHAIIDSGDVDITVIGGFDPTQLPADAEQQPQK